MAATHSKSDWKSYFIPDMPMKCVHLI